MTSSKKDCKRYFIKYDVSIEINRHSKEMKLEQEIQSVQCTEYCEKDPKVRIAFELFVKISLLAKSLMKNVKI